MSDYCRLNMESIIASEFILSDCFYRSGIDHWRTNRLRSQQNNIVPAKICLLVHSVPDSVLTGVKYESTKCTHLILWRKLWSFALVSLSSQSVPPALVCKVKTQIRWIIPLVHPRVSLLSMKAPVVFSPVYSLLPVPACPAHYVT